MMAQALAKLMMGLLWKLASEAFFSKVIVYGLHALAKETSNALDDKLVAAVAESLAVKVE
jgi:hypothetical protein